MKNILIGFFLIFLDFSFNFYGVKIGLLPNFIGYYFLGEGIKEFLNKSEHFKKVSKLIMPLLLFSLLLYCLDLFTITAAMGYFSYLFAVISIGMAFYVSYHVICGIREMGMDTAKLKNLWKAMLCANAVWFVLSFIPVLAVLGGIAAIFAAVLFLLEFNSIKKSYENSKKEGTFE